MDHALLLLDLLWENYDKDANPLWTLLEEAIQNLPSSCHGQRALMEEKTSRPDGAFTRLKNQARKGSEGHKSWKAGAWVKNPGSMG